MKITTDSAPKALTKMRGQINQLILAGEYTDATRLLRQILELPALELSDRNHYRFEIERLARVRKDFSARRDEVIRFIQDIYPQLEEIDLETWEQKDSLEYRIIDGQKYYFEQAARNLFRIDPTLRKLWDEKYPDQTITSGSGASLNLDEHLASIVKRSTDTSEQFVLPVKIRIKQSLEVEANAVPPNETIRCWLPYPRHIPDQQDGIHFIKSQPAEHRLAANESLQRTIYFEKFAGADQPTVFSVEYDLTTRGVYQHINPEMVVRSEPDSYIQKFLQEEPPHITFTPELKKLSETIVGDEQNPYQKARLILTWMNENIPWASAREYSTIKNISEYALINRHGDCGIQTLLFITMCRLNGIPARWQSGWELQPPDDSMHDWGMIYFEPYGWVPMDVTYGIRKSDDPKVKWFYLSGLDSYRIIFNDAYGQALVPAKEHFRSETLDNQRGEVEWSGGNIYFDKWRWNFEWTILGQTDIHKKSVD